MLRAYKFRFYPNRKQTVLLENTLKLCREIYNSALQERKYAYEACNPIGFYDQKKELPQLKKAFPEYRGVHSQVLQDVLLRLDRAFDNFFGESKGKGGVNA